MMPGKRKPRVEWTERSQQHALNITDYLTVKFSQREIDEFYSLLAAFEKAVSEFPNLYPGTPFHKNLRRAVLNKACSIFYKVDSKSIKVVAILDNRVDISKRIM